MTRIACAIVVLASFPSLVSPAGAQPAGRILVMPFENVAHDSRIFWLSEASAVVLADDLSALGVDAMAREERRAAFDRLQVPPAASLTDATVIRIGQLVGASQVVVGTLRRQGDTLIVNARSIALDVGRIQHNATEGGPMSDLFAIFERVARTIVPDSPRTTEEIERQHPPIAAFENYVKGLLAATPATAINYLDTALRLDPMFARARLALWDVYTEQGNHERALAAVERVAPGQDVARRVRRRVPAEAERAGLGVRDAHRRRRDGGCRGGDRRREREHERRGGQACDERSDRAGLRQCS